ncbi:MAG: substrate-binding domain-containing protein [Hyphomonadaceae bacterium]|nr:substrate-binding domain-containing protein [Hyphomonadaceae bacterium]
MGLKQLVMALCLIGLAACGDSQLSAFDGEPVPPPPPLGQADRIRIVGSSTVAPFSTTVAEQFGASTRFATPIVETTGTGGGFKAFCHGVGPEQPSISNASRPIKSSELNLCAEAGVNQLVEVKIGFDGIVLASGKAGPDFDLTKEQIFRALAVELPDGNGGWVANPNRLWSDVSAELPAIPIYVYGPPPTSGTRDAFVEIAMELGAEAVPEMVALEETDPEAFARRATTIRTDDAWVDAGENDTAMIQTLTKNPNVVGVLGFSSAEQNGDRIKAARVNGIEPTFNNIATGEYRISRSMFFYVKVQNVPLVPGLMEFVDAFTREDSWGPEGYLAEKGLIPLPEEERARVREQSLALTLLEAEG